MATLTANGQPEQFIGDNGRMPRRKDSGFRNGQVEKNTTVNGNKTQSIWRRGIQVSVNRYNQKMQFQRWKHNKYDQSHQALT